MNFEPKKAPENIFDLGSVRDAGKKLAEMNTNEIKELGQKLNSYFAKGLADATSSINSSSSAVSASFAPTTGAIKNLVDQQEYYKRIYSPWVDMSSSIQMTPINYSYLKTPPVIAPPSDTDQIEKFLEALTTHFDGEKIRTEQQTQLLTSLAGSAEMQMKAQQASLQVALNAEQSGKRWAILNVFLVVISIAVGVLTFYYSQGTKLEIQEPVKVRVEADTLKPITIELQALKREIRSLRTQQNPK